MNKKILMVLSTLMLCFCFIFSACTPTENNNNNPDNPHNSDEDDTYYTVTFDSQGGSSVESQRVKEGNPVSAPASPRKENFDFVGWFRSASEDAARWNFSTDRVNEDLTLYAHWTAKQEEEPPTPSETLTYERKTEGDGYIVTGDSGQATNIVIPAEHDGMPVVGIADSAFAYSKHTSDITSVTIPDSVTEIGKNAFHNQDALVSVKIGTDSKLEKIGNNAFSGNSALESIYLPAGLNSLGDSVFNNCGGLNTITVATENETYSGEGNNLIELATHKLIRGSNSSVIPNSVTTIGEASFRRATLTELTIPSSVTTIENYAFSDSAIVTIIYGGTTEAWNKAVTNENGKEKMWKSSNQNITVRCSDTQGGQDDEKPTKKILVAYFSATNNTEGVAEKIAEITGGDLYEIIPEQPYTDEDLDYGNRSSRSSVEMNDPSARPAINGSVENMESYDVVFIGYPIWWGEAPRIMSTFIESYDFSGKTLVAFCTSASSGFGRSDSALRSSASGATWLDGKRFSAGASTNDVRSWIESLQF